MRNKGCIATLLILVATTALSACADPRQSADPLENSNWTLIAYRKTSPIEGTTITARFRDGQVNGSAGCNSYFGDYEIDGDQITIEGLAWTEMACMNPEGVMEQEQVVMRLFSEAERFTLEEGRLMIFREDGEALTFDLVE